jgi:hypothetical protein
LQHSVAEQVQRRTEPGVQLDRFLSLGRGGAVVLNGDQGLTELGFASETQVVHAKRAPVRSAHAGRFGDESHKLPCLRYGFFRIAAPPRSKHPDERAFCLRQIVCLLVHLFELLQAGFPGRMESEQRASGNEAWVDFQRQSKFLDRFGCGPGLVEIPLTA